MSAIAGVVDLSGLRKPEETLLRAMNRVQRHRGPDGEGLHLQPGVGFGNQRLLTIGSKPGVQPLYNEDRSVVLSFDGTIFNFRELRETLAKDGHHFQSDTDAEVVVHAWEAWGSDCLQHFDGMFAFALWDERIRTLFLARDRLGIRPLFYSEANDQLIFASELKAVLLHPDVDRSIDPQAVEDYFGFGYIPDPKSIYRAVRKLAPGSFLEVRRGSRPRIQQYWDLPLADQQQAGDARGAAEALRVALKDAVQSHLVSDVPLGAFLSGGIDSSAIVAMMRELDQGPLLSCSIGFDETRFDESRYARMVAEAKGTEHRMETVQAGDYALLDRLVSLYDEPYADSSAIPTYRACELARRHVTVVLSGDGGDEAFLGYRRHRLFGVEERLRNRLPPGLRRAVFGPLGRWYPKLDWAPRVLRGKTTFQALARDPVAAYFHAISVCLDDVRRQLLSTDLRKELDGYEAVQVFRDHAHGKSFIDGLAMAQYLDYKTYLPGDVLTKVDRASMAHGLEVRAPFLDHHLVEWAVRLPTSIKLRGAEGKHVLKKAMEPMLPHEVLYRRKMGFSVPLGLWFRGSLKEHIAEVVGGRRLAESGFFEPAALRKLVDDHHSGRGEHSATLWALLMFDGFLQTEASASAPVRLQTPATPI